MQEWIRTVFVFLFSAGAYVPLMIGGYQHPKEINVASYSLWLILSSMLFYSARKQGFDSWRLPAGFIIGNGSMLVLAASLRDYTFNLGSAESIVLYGLISTLSVWGIVGHATGKWNPRILYLGGVIADIFSFYPQLKQYLLPHDPPTRWLLLGWTMWAIAAFISVICVEQFFTRLRKAEGWKAKILVWEGSLFSLENGLFMVITITIMVLN